MVVDVTVRKGKGGLNEVSQHGKKQDSPSYVELATSGKNFCYWISEPAGTDSTPSSPSRPPEYVHFNTRVRCVSMMGSMCCGRSFIVLAIFGINMS